MLNKFVAYKNDGGIIRSLDFSEATLTELPHSFMSKGNETVDGNLSKINVTNTWKSVVAQWIG